MTRRPDLRVIGAAAPPPARRHPRDPAVWRPGLARARAELAAARAPAPPSAPVTTLRPCGRCQTFTARADDAGAALCPTCTRTAELADAPPAEPQPAEADA